MFATLLGILASLAKFMPTIVAFGDKLFVAWQEARLKQEAAAERTRLEAIDARQASEGAAINAAMTEAAQARAKQAAALHAEWFANADAAAKKAADDAVKARSELADSHPKS